MLNLFNLKKNNTQIINTKKQGRLTLKHFPSPIREWFNSIYAYNKYSVNLIPSTTNTVMVFIKNYFDLYNKHLESKMRTRKLLLRLRKLSSNKYYISKAGFKHTNNKVYINLYVFNRQKNNHLLTLKKWYLKTLLKKSNTKNINLNLIKRLKTIKNKGLEAVKLVNKDKPLLLKALATVNNNSKYNINTIKSLSNYTKDFYIDLLDKSLKKIRMFYYYKQLLYLNKSKLNYVYLQYLKIHLEKLYSKNVEFNIINLKRFYLNSDILSESISLKTARNRRRLRKYMDTIKNKIVLKKKKIFLGYLPTAKSDLENLTHDKVLLHHGVINNLKYRHVTGFKLQAKGKLSKNSAASRTSFKSVYNGGIYNIDSSDRGLSSVLLKGNLRANLQSTTLSSKGRLGAFGIKGWVSGN